MGITTQVREGVTIVDLEGQLAVRGLELAGAVRGLLDRGVRQILLNLEGVDLMDSSGLGELVWAERAARELGATLKLAGLSAEAQRTMATTGLADSFDLYDDEIDALASFRR